MAMDGLMTTEFLNYNGYTNDDGIINDNGLYK
jgi:hypothetical protein